MEQIISQLKIRRLQEKELTKILFEQEERFVDIKNQVRCNVKKISKLTEKIQERIEKKNDFNENLQLVEITLSQTGKYTSTEEENSHPMKIKVPSSDLKQYWKIYNTF